MLMMRQFADLVVVLKQYTLEIEVLEVVPEARSSLMINEILMIV